MKISEIFYSVQGEGKYIGEPAVFVRLFGCPVNCSFCDSRFSIEGTKWEELKIREVVNRVKKYNCNNVVITGGEPFMQRSQLSELVDILYIENFMVFIETAAVYTIDNSHERSLFNSCKLVTISPKESWARQIGLSEYVKVVRDNYMIVPDRTILKFVYENEGSEEFIKNFIKAGDFRVPVYILPQSRNREELVKNLPVVIEYCKRENFIVSDRLHIVAWDDKRGV